MDKKNAINNLKKELEDIKKRNMELWMQYGSELALGSLTDPEKELENKIKELEGVNGQG